MTVGATIERRTIDLSELRIDAQGEQKLIRGYAAVFDSMSQPLGGFREVIRKGAFRKALNDGDIRALWNHDPNYVLGRKSARTLQLNEDEKGLFSRITPPDTQWARDLMQSIQRGDVSQMSFGFRVVKDNWLPAGQDGLPVRELLSVQLFDVSPVTFPAYPQTEVHVRSLVESVQSRLAAGVETEGERQALRLVLQGMLRELEAAGSGSGSRRSPAESRADAGERAESDGPRETEERQRTLRDRRKRLLDLAIS